MSPQPRRPEPTPDEVRRRRTVALAVLVAGFLMLLIAVVSAVGGGGGGGGSNAGERRATTERPAAGRRRQPARPASPTAGARVPASAPGAHRAPNEAVPILMYHVINSPRPDTSQPQLWVPRDEFAAEMKYLADQGYHAVTLQQVWDAWKSGGLLPSKPIVISFDDGYNSQYTNALPILRQQGWPGVLNLQVNQTQQDLPPDKVKALISAGWEVDAHTISHPDLTSTDDATLQQEVSGSRQQLRQQYGVPVNFFCYPAGRFDDRVIAAVRAAGYVAATTTEYGLASPQEDPYQLRRVRVSGGDGVDGLSRDLSGAQQGQTGGQQGE